MVGATAGPVLDEPGKHPPTPSEPSGVFGIEFAQALGGVVLVVVVVGDGGLGIGLKHPATNNTPTAAITLYRIHFFTITPTA